MRLHPVYIRRTRSNSSVADSVQTNHDGAPCWELGSSTDDSTQVHRVRAHSRNLKGSAVLLSCACAFIIFAGILL